MCKICFSKCRPRPGSLLWGFNPCLAAATSCASTSIGSSTSSACSARSARSACCACTASPGANSSCSSRCCSCSSRCCSCSSCSCVYSSCVGTSASESWNYLKYHEIVQHPTVIQFNIRYRSNHLIVFPNSMLRHKCPALPAARSLRGQRHEYHAECCCFCPSTICKICLFCFQIDCLGWFRQWNSESRVSFSRIGTSHLKMFGAKLVNQMIRKFRLRIWWRDPEICSGSESSTNLRFQVQLP